MEGSFEDIWEDSLMTTKQEDQTEESPSRFQPDEQSREIQLLQAVLDKYADKLVGVTLQAGEENVLNKF